MSLRLTKRLAFLDVETTGLSVVEDRIVEIAVLLLAPDGSTTSYSRLVNPQRAIPREATAVHGITNEDVASAKTFAECAQEIADFIADADIAGYNVRTFDIPVLVESFARAGVEWSLDGRCIVDALKLFHVMEPRNLRAAHSFYCDKEMLNSHRALEDVTACKEVLEAQVQRYRGRTMRDSQGVVIGTVENDVRSLHDLLSFRCVDVAGKLLEDADGNVVLNFGKHLGQTVAAVSRTDRQYLQWVLTSRYFPLDTRRTLQAALRRVLAQQSSA